MTVSFLSLTLLDKKVRQSFVKKKKKESKTIVINGNIRATYIA